MAVFSRFISNFNSLFTTQCTVHVQLTNRGLITTVCILIRFECYQKPKGKRTVTVSMIVVTTIIDTVTVYYVCTDFSRFL